MGEAVLTGNPPLTIAIRRSGRARRMTLKVSRRDGAISLTLPPGVALEEGLGFARAREAWLRRHAGRSPGRRIPAAGTVIEVEGAPRLVCVADLRAPRLEAERLWISAARPPGPQIAALLRLVARERLVAASERHANRLGRAFGRVTLRDTRSRWGSCSSKGDLMFCWRLILAPPEVLDYVAAHEVAHLERMDHSPAFWLVVEALMPDHRARRAWLREHGAALQAWDFGA